MIVIVGAGLAGLVCARALRAAGREVLVLERELVPGGRLRTEQHPEGFLLDRGFQVLFTAYPAARRHLSYSRLTLQEFAPGAILARGGRLHAIADPLRARRYLLASLTNPLFGPLDKLRVLPLALAARRTPLQTIFAQPDVRTEDYLRGRKLSDRFIDSFVRPFYGGIFLDRALDTSSATFRFTFKMLAEGETVLPARGIQQIPEQLAESLPPDCVRYGVAVESLLFEEGQVSGLRTDDGEEVAADAMVIATDPQAAARLLGDEAIPHQPVACACAYFASPISLYPDPLIVLNANPDPYVNNLVQITNIAPGYAPPGQHLLSLTILGAVPEDDATVEARCRTDLATIFPGKDLAALRLLRVVRIPFAQFAQPPGIYARLAANTTAYPNLFLASEATASSSIQGAMASGEAAAGLVLAMAPAPISGQGLGVAG